MNRHQFSLTKGDYTWYATLSTLLQAPFKNYSKVLWNWANSPLYDRNTAGSGSASFVGFVFKCLWLASPKLLILMSKELNNKKSLQHGRITNYWNIYNTLVLKTFRKSSFDTDVLIIKSVQYTYIRKTFVKQLLCNTKNWHLFNYNCKVDIVILSFSSACDAELFHSFLWKRHRCC